MPPFPSPADEPAVEGKTELGGDLNMLPLGFPSHPAKLGALGKPREIREAFKHAYLGFLSCPTKAGWLGKPREIGEACLHASPFLS